MHKHPWLTPQLYTDALWQRFEFVVNSPSSPSDKKFQLKYHSNPFAPNFPKKRVHPSPNNKAISSDSCRSISRTERTGIIERKRSTTRTIYPAPVVIFRDNSMHARYTRETFPRANNIVNRPLRFDVPSISSKAASLNASFIKSFLLPFQRGEGDQSFVLNSTRDPSCPASFSVHKFVLRSKKKKKKKKVSSFASRRSFRSQIYRDVNLLALQQTILFSLPIRNSVKGFSRLVRFTIERGQLPCVTSPTNFSKEAI